MHRIATRLLQSPLACQAHKRWQLVPRYLPLAGGEDAFFVLEHDMGVFDGVGGWAALGHDAGVFTRGFAEAVAGTNVYSQYDIFNSINSI